MRFVVEMAGTAVTSRASATSLSPRTGRDTVCCSDRRRAPVWVNVTSCRSTNANPPARANEDPDDWWIRDICVPTDHDVADLADAASGGVEDATAEHVGQRDRLVGDSPTSSDPIVQSG
jgi:hypothetical protein